MTKSDAKALRLADLPDFPAPELDWTLGKLLDRTTMVAQFAGTKLTLSDAMLMAFQGVIGPGYEPDGVQTDEGFAQWIADGDARAAAARDCVLNHLNRGQQKTNICDGRQS